MASERQPHSTAAAATLNQYDPLRAAAAGDEIAITFGRLALHLEQRLGREFSRPSDVYVEARSVAVYTGNGLADVSFSF
jgi:hypothetical protein